MGRHQTSMGNIRRMAISGGLIVANFTQKLGLMAGARGLGVIFTLHHVRPYQPKSFEPNRHLEITPDFLDRAILRLKADGYRFARLEDVAELIAEGRRNEPFAVLTLDDGFRNNVEHALPVFERHQVPATIFIAKGLSERSHSMWWETAAALIARSDCLQMTIGGTELVCETLSTDQKNRAFDRISQAIFAQDEALAIADLNRAADRQGINPLALVADQVMNADELKAIAKHPLLTLGAHTVSHRGLALLDDQAVLAELTESAAYVEAISGTRPTTLAYPYGDRRSVSPKVAALSEWAGFRLAVTTRPGTLSERSLEHAHTLPRVSLNGFYQKPAHVSALASGIPFRR